MRCHDCRTRSVTTATLTLFPEVVRMGTQPRPPPGPWMSDGHSRTPMRLRCRSPFSCPGRGSGHATDVHVKSCVQFI